MEAILIVIGVLQMIVLVLGIVISSLKKFVLAIIAFSLLFFTQIFSLFMPAMTNFLFQNQAFDTYNAVTLISSFNGLLRLTAYVLLVIGIYRMVVGRKDTETLK